jgi:hypothetical protein
MEEDYKEKIIELIESISSTKLLEYIYNFIKIAVTTWK